MSITDWIKQYVPGGTSSRLGQLLDVAYNIEYGAESNVQSALNMLYLLAYPGQGQLRIFGHRTRSTTCAAATIRSRRRSPPGCPARSRPATSWSRSSRRRRADTS